LPSRYLLFFGAGASKPFGIPTMEEFVDKLSFNKEDEDLLRDVKQALEKFGIRSDLESIFTALNEYKSAFDSSMLSPALAIRLREALYDKVSIDYGKEKTESIEQLRQRVQEQIVQVCKISGRGDQILGTFESFLSSALAHPANPDQYTNILANGQVNFFTTNYDLILQTYINLAKTKHPQLGGWVVQDGTTQADRNHWDPYNYDNSIQGTMLVPLHGSVELHSTKFGSVVKGQGNGREFYGEELTGDLLIYPVRGKYIYQDPFARMFSLFRQDLETTVYAVFVGFSFNDEAIRDTLISTIQRRRKLHATRGQQMIKVIVYSPHAEQVIEKRLAPYFEQFPDWKQYVKHENRSFEDPSGHSSLRNQLQAG
jgi:hypothetical protein